MPALKSLLDNVSICFISVLVSVDHLFSFRLCFSLFCMTSDLQFYPGHFIYNAGRLLILFKSLSSYLGFACRTLSTFVSCSSNNNFKSLYILFWFALYFWIPCSFCSVPTCAAQCPSVWGSANRWLWLLSLFRIIIAIFPGVWQEPCYVLTALAEWVATDSSGWVHDWPWWYAYCGRYAFYSSGNGKGSCCWFYGGWALSHLDVLCYMDSFLGRLDVVAVENQALLPCLTQDMVDIAIVAALVVVWVCCSSKCEVVLWIWPVLSWVFHGGNTDAAAMVHWAVYALSIGYWWISLFSLSCATCFGSFGHRSQFSCFLLFLFYAHWKFQIAALSKAHSSICGR